MAAWMAHDLHEHRSAQMGLCSTFLLHDSVIAPTPACSAAHLTEASWSPDMTSCSRSGRKVFTAALLCNQSRFFFRRLESWDSAFCARPMKHTLDAALSHRCGRLRCKGTCWLNNPCIGFANLCAIRVFGMGQPATHAPALLAALHSASLWSNVAGSSVDRP